MLSLFLCQTVLVIGFFCLVFLNFFPLTTIRIKVEIARTQR